MSRVPIIAGNWKMNKTIPQAIEFVREIGPILGDFTGVQVVIVPPFTALYAVREELAGHDIAIDLGAQDVFWKNSGAYTSQISPVMLVDIGVDYVIIGHSEPRGRFGVAEEGANDDFYRYFGESDGTVNRKIKAAFSNDLSPILCVGETLAERKRYLTDHIISDQLTKALAGVSRDDVGYKLVIAYEPVWAIGTGETCDAIEANRVCGEIRAHVAKLYDGEVADTLRIQYGGSMKPSNAKELLAQEHIDGGLIGGASLIPSDFAAIVSAAG